MAKPVKARTTKTAKPKGKRIKVSIPVFLGASDGDVRVTVCKTEEDADRFAEKNLEDGNSSLCGEVQWIEVVVDERGKLLSGYEEPPDSDDDSDDSDSDNSDENPLGWGAKVGKL